MTECHLHARLLGDPVRRTVRAAGPRYVDGGSRGSGRPVRSTCEGRPDGLRSPRCRGGMPERRVSPSRRSFPWWCVVHAGASACGRVGPAGGRRPGNRDRPAGPRGYRERLGWGNPPSVPPDRFARPHALPNVPPGGRFRLSRTSDRVQPNSCPRFRRRNGPKSPARALRRCRAAASRTPRTPPPRFLTRPGPVRDALRVTYGAGVEVGTEPADGRTTGGSARSAPAAQPVQIALTVEIAWCSYLLSRPRSWMRTESFLASTAKVPGTLYQVPRRSCWLT